MEKNTIENILNFLKINESKKIPESWFDLVKKLKLVKELEKHPDNRQYKYEGDLNLIKTNIKKLPNDLYVYGDLDLYDCNQLKELPSKLYVGGGLYIGGLTIKELPNNLHVTYSLSLYECKQLKELPNKLYVGGDFFIRGTPLADKYTDEQIREIVTSTGGRIDGKIIR